MRQSSSEAAAPPAPTPPAPILPVEGDEEDEEYEAKKSYSHRTTHPPSMNSRWFGPSNSACLESVLLETHRLNSIDLQEKPRKY